MTTVTDDERTFLVTELGLSESDGAAMSLTDLRMAYYLAGGGSAAADAVAADLLAHEGSKHVQIPRYPDFTPSVVGALYNGNSTVGTGTRTTGTALDVLVIGGPLYSGETGVTMDQFDVNLVTPGTAGAIYRAGVWTIDNQDDPFAWTLNVQWATLLAEVLQGGAAFPMDGVAGVKTRVPAAAIVVPPNTWFACGGVSQVAVCQPTIGASAAIFSPHGQSNATAGLVSADSWLRRTGVNAALGNFTPNTTQMNVGHGVGFRRSA